jgi:hypothetical protein
MDRERHLDILSTICSIPTALFYEARVARYILDELQRIGIPAQINLTIEPEFVSTDDLSTLVELLTRAAGHTPSSDQRQLAEDLRNDAAPAQDRLLSTAKDGLYATKIPVGQS